MVKVLDCGIVLSEFELQLCYCVHFGKGMNHFILPIVPLLFFLKGGFGIK